MTVIINQVTTLGFEAETGLNTESPPFLQLHRTVLQVGRSAFLPGISYEWWS